MLEDAGGFCLGLIFFLKKYLLPQTQQIRGVFASVSELFSRKKINSNPNKSRKELQPPSKPNNPKPEQAPHSTVVITVRLAEALQLPPKQRSRSRSLAWSRYPLESPSVQTQQDPGMKPATAHQLSQLRS